MKLRPTFPTKKSVSALIRNKKVSIPLAAVFVFFAGICWSIIPVLIAPGTDSVTARLAEWGRDHYLSSVVTFAENVQYKLNPPKVGGTPDASLLQSLAPATTPPSSEPTVSETATPTPTSVPTPTETATTSPISTSTAVPDPSQVAPLDPLSPFASPEIAGEGVFKTVFTINDEPAVRIAFLRPDQEHSSYLTGVAVMSSSLLRVALHPGFLEPGELSNYQTPDKISNSDLPGLVATFNSGFKLKDSKGGYFSEGFTAKRLEKGAASFVIYEDGSTDIGSWGSDVSMDKNVISVRQNLSLLVDNGVVAEDLQKNILSKWGYTIKNDYFVWRSGIGIKADGNLIYVAGNALSVQSLADILQGAGAVRAMELDINPEWISYMWYPKDGKYGPQKLLAFDRPANRFMKKSSRDFFAVSIR
ncbi:MAG: phosphodiester glycosidase family protein [Actinobacteria bacterium]|nr:phosphodiester glycosidase family protein [Actinomycetota bacterium]